jgi:CheY-like chemotaxis protein
MNNRNEPRPPSSRVLNILLADDDEDDRLLFEEALKELPMNIKLTSVVNGTQLMERLTQQKTKVPDVLFLDLNMPGKNGFACLKEIKLNSRFERLPVFIFSTAFDEDMLNLVYKDAAHYYIRKPAEFSQLKNVVLKALTLVLQKKTTLPLKENFVLTGDL